MTSIRQSEYDQLRSWYLARLRKLSTATDDVLDQSPASLVVADKEKFERRAVTSAALKGGESDFSAKLKNWKPDKFRLEQKILALVLVSLCMHLTFAVCILVIVGRIDVPQVKVAQTLVVAAIIGSLGLAVFFISFFRRVVILRLRKLNETVQAATGNQLDSETTADEIGCTEMLLMQAALAKHEAEARENAIADFALDVVCSLDSKMRIIAVNPAIVKHWGYGRAELVGRELASIVTEEYADAFAKDFGGVPGKGGRQVITQIRCNTGAMKDILWSLEWSPEANSWFCIAKDITAEKEIERIKQHFVSIVSHDLKSPLSAITVSLELLREGAVGDLPQRVHEVIDGALRSANRLVNLINGILDAERAETGILTVFPEITELDLLLKMSIESVQALADKKGIKFDYIESQAQIYVEQERILQAVVNLLSNALKFSPRDSTISISTKLTLGQAEIRIKDAGRGVPKHLQRTIFDRFKQVNAADSKQRLGSGLGLWITRMMVEAHGGSIGVESEDNQGSTFWMRLPRAQSSP